MFRISVLTLSLFSCISFTYAQFPALTWATYLGNGNQNVDGYLLATDNSGNVINGGLFYSTADFDPGPGVFNMTAVGPGGEDHYICKLDAAGNFLWARQFDLATGLTEIYLQTDAAGNIYFGGIYNGTVDFDPGPGTYNLSGNNASFLLKLDLAGNFVWAKNIANGVGITSVLRALKVTPSGEIYTGGQFTGTVDFDPGPGTYNLSSPGINNYFVSRLDASGNFLWAAAGSGSGSSILYGLEVDALQNIYITGRFDGTTDFDPGPGIQNISTLGAVDIFVNKLNASGNLVFAKTIASAQNEEVLKAGMDAAGNFYLAGYSNANTDFDPGPGTYFLPPGGFFVVKLDPNAGLVWANITGTTYQHSPYDFKIDKAGNSYLCGGVVTVTLDFDPGPGVANYTPVGGGGYLRKLDASGNFEYLYTQDAAGSQYAQGCHVDNNGQTYLTGNFINTVDFAPGPPVSNLVTNNYFKSFIVKLNECSDATTITQQACNSFTMNGQTYTQSGTYMQSLTNSVGCDSSIILNLTINQPSVSSITQSVCDSYTLNGQTYTQSGTYTQHLTNSVGCDSAITLNLTIRQSTGSTLNISSCNSYTLNGQNYNQSGTYAQQITNHAGCDSNITLNLTIQTPTSSTLNATACNSYTLNGQTYTNSGTYNQILPGGNINGCDSNITLHLIINNPTSSVINATACNSYTLNGQTYAQSGVYNQILPGGNMNGCDSNITLNVTINHPTSSVINAAACNSYTLNGQAYTQSGTYNQILPGGNMNGCDSNITLNLTINLPTSSVITTTACDSYTLNGQAYTQSGTYNQIIPGGNANGCDSNITLNLTITSIDNNITQNDHVLTADEANATYQWIDCITQQPIPGATTQTYTANVNGQYAVILDNGTCTDTSACYTVITLGLLQNQPLYFDAYPNPNQGIFTLRSSVALENAMARITDLTGRIIWEKPLFTGHLWELDIEAEPAGIYLLELNHNGWTSRLRMVKH